MPMKITRSAELKKKIDSNNYTYIAFGRQILGKIPYCMYSELGIHY
jgi:hypothetical protein